MTTHVLLIVNSPLLKGILTTQLAEEGFHVTALDTSSPIAEHLNRESPALVILDMPLSDGNGSDLAAWLCLWHKIPLLVMAPPGASEDIQTRFRGAYVLAKPFTLDRLLGNIASALGKNRGMFVA